MQSLTGFFLKDKGLKGAQGVGLRAQSVKGIAKVKIMKRIITKARKEENTRRRLPTSGGPAMARQANNN